MKAKVVGVSMTAAVVAIAGLALCLPNVLWLKHSTIRITNQGKSVISQATLHVGNESIAYQSIEPGEAEFALLPQSAQGAVAIMLPPSRNLDSFCHTYVDTKMYHLDVIVKNGKVIACEASLPMLSNLWVLKALR